MYGEITCEIWGVHEIIVICHKNSGRALFSGPPSLFSAPPSLVGYLMLFGDVRTAIADIRKNLGHHSPLSQLYAAEKAQISHVISP